MADRLEPINSVYLSPEEVVDRLRSEFSFVTTDSEAGKDHVGDMIATFVRLKAPQEIINHHLAAQPHAVELTATDDESSDVAFVHTVVMPNTGLFFGYHSAQHQEAADSLIERCATVLGYRRISL